MGKIHIGAYEVGMMPTNCYYMFAEHEDCSSQEEQHDCIVFDPGDHGAALCDALEKQGLTIRAVFLTHAHFDHILGVGEMIGRSAAELYAYEGEKRLCSDAGLNLSAGYNCPCTVEPDRYLRDDETVTSAGITVKVLATPGHTEGSCCYYIENTDDEGTVQRFLIAGDTVFAGSVGRTDFPTGSMSRLMRSIEEKILPLPDDTMIFPGHGGMTDVKTERENNPYFR